MKIVFIMCLMLLTVSVLLAVTEETASLREFLYGSTDQTAYDNFYSRVVEGLASPGYNQYAPWEQQSNPFGNFYLPGTAELNRWSNVVNNFLQLNFDEALGLIEEYSYPYEIVRFNDIDTDRTYYMLRELLNLDFFDDNDYPENPLMHQHGSFDFGWGLYIFNPDSNQPIVITTPHPKDDFISIPISCLAFQMWDARYLMISGAGREARWTRVGAYTNAKSLSDPTRREEHPYNTFYKAACADIRQTFGRRELSPQIHSFDHTHMGYNSLQISAGNSSQNYPNLPIRDVSGNFLDIVNASPYVVIPENTIGRHEDILVTDYYSVYYNTHGFNYNNDGELLEVSNNINLPGYSANRQLAHTMIGWNRFDVFTPFFHIEMEELPSCYPQDMETYWWFYGYNEETEIWVPGDYFTRTIAYYTPWLEHMAEILPTVLALDDGLPPTDPTNLRLTDIRYRRISLAWERSFSYDFRTYEILYSTQPIDLVTPNYGIINRNHIATLAGQAYEAANFTQLQAGLKYYLRIRARDYNNNYSEVSNEVTVDMIPANVLSLNAYGRDGYVDIDWYVESQRNNRGFRVWRRNVEEEEYDVIASYENEPSLIGEPADSVLYRYRDDEVENGVVYEYLVSSNGVSGEEYLHRIQIAASPEPIYTLFFRNLEGTVVDSVEFGINRYTADGFNSNYDILKRSEPDEEEQDFIYAHFYYPLHWSAPSILLQRDINRFYNTDKDYKFWRLRARADLIDEPITISVSDNYTRTGEKLILRAQETGEMFDLTENPVEFQFNDERYRYWTLYWGNLLPNVSMNEIETQYLQANDEIRFEWKTEFKPLVESFELFMLSKTDSLYIAAGLERETVYYDWVVPDSLNINDMQFIIRANLTNESYADYKSKNSLGIVPSGYRLKSPSGWHLVSFPLQEEGISFNEIYGDNAQISGQHMTAIDSVAYFEFGRSYWVYHEEDIDRYLSGKIHRYDYNIRLFRGWNLIPNVFLVNIRKQDLTITRRGAIGIIKYPWIDAVEEGRVSNSIFGLKDSRFVEIDTLQIGGAYWLYSLQNDLTLNFTLFNKNPDPEPEEILWQAVLEVHQSEHIRDEIIIGSPTGIYSPKPPARPGQKCNFYLPGSIEPFTKFHKLFKNDLDEKNPDTRSWNFIVEIGSRIQPLVFRLTEHNLPDNYHIELLIDNQQTFLLPDEEYIYYPTGDMIAGRIQVSNINPTSVENTPNVPVLFSNYPNPFNIGRANERSGGGTNISFWINRQEEVKLTIFNIKGQRVVTLINDVLDIGKYTVSWDGYGDHKKPAASGVYFYRLNVAGKDISNKKMLLLK